MVVALCAVCFPVFDVACGILSSNSREQYMTSCLDNDICHGIRSRSSPRTIL
jgi:hypothetical protein